MRTSRDRGSAHRQKSSRGTRGIDRRAAETSSVRFPRNSGSFPRDPRLLLLTMSGSTISTRRHRCMAEHTPKLSGVVLRVPPRRSLVSIRPGHQLRGGVSPLTPQPKKNDPSVQKSRRVKDGCQYGRACKEGHWESVSHEERSAGCWSSTPAVRPGAALADSPAQPQRTSPSVRFPKFRDELFKRQRSPPARGDLRPYTAG